MKRLKCVGGKVTVYTRGKILVLPTGEPSLLPMYNEYTIGRSVYAEGIYDFSNDLNINQGLLHLNKSWIAVYDPADTKIDFFLFTYKPTNLSMKVNSSGIITELTLYADNGFVYHDKYTYYNLLQDSDSDLIPDVFDISCESSLGKFLNSHSYLDLNKIDLEKLSLVDGQCIVSVSGKILVLPTGNPAILPAFNEFVKNPLRISAPDYPYGGTNVAGSQYNMPGSIHCQTTNATVTDPVGNNSGNVVSANALSCNNYLTVDTTAHTLTQEFIVKNTAVSNDSLAIDTCDDATGWGSSSMGTVTSITVENGRIKVTGTTNSSGRLVVMKTVTAKNLSNKQFLCNRFESNLPYGALYLRIGSGISNYLLWWSNFTSANTNQRFVNSLKAPVNSNQFHPNASGGTIDLSNITVILIGFESSDFLNTETTFYFDDIFADSALETYVEIATPDTLASDVSAEIYTSDNNDIYHLYKTCKLNSGYEEVSTTAENGMLYSGTTTTFSDLYGTGNGFSVFPKGLATQSVSGSLSGTSITYTSKEGSKNNIGLRLELPPSDNDRTKINKVKIKLVLYYGNNGITAFNFSNDTSLNYGIRNLSSPWIALLDAPSNDTIQDTTGLGNNGVLSNVAVLDSMYFNGVSSYISVNSLTNYIDATKTFSVCMKLTPEQVVNGSTILDCAVSASNRFGIQLAYGGIQAGIYNGSAYVNSKSSTDNVIFPNCECDLIYTYNGNEAKLYLNGIEHTGSETPSTTIGTGVCKIGSRTTPAANRYYTGYISEVRVYNTALTQTDAIAYHAGQSIPSTNLVADLKLPPQSDNIDYYLFASRPSAFAYKCDENGKIVELTLSAGSGQLYHKQVETANPFTDADFDYIPDVLDIYNTNSTAYLLQECTDTCFEPTISTYVVPTITNTKILPSALLSDTYQSDTISVQGAKGEFVSANFLLNSNSQIDSLHIDVSDLVGSSGTIDSDSIDLRVVKCWYQGGYRNANTSAYDVEGRFLTPELLLHDESLVKVDGETWASYNVSNSNGKNYLKVDGSYIDISVRGEDPSGSVVIPLSERPILDAETLQPVSLPAHFNKQFWITLHVPDAAIAGNYSGAITVSSGNTTLKTITVNVTVLPIVLSLPNVEYSIYHQAVSSQEGSISVKYKSIQQFTAEMQNLCDHGILNPIVPPHTDDNHLMQDMAIRQNVGMDNSNLFYWSMDYPDLSVISHYKTLLAPYGVENVYLYGLDEQEVNRERLAAEHALGGKHFNAQSKAQAEAAADVLDLAIVCYEPDSATAALYHSNGHRVFSYGNPQSIPEYPRAFRLNYGLLLWQVDFDGAMDFAYQWSSGDVWNDFDYTPYRDHNFTYPTANGVIDTIQWEGFREAVTDMRYLATLQHRINTNPCPASVEANNWLTTLKATDLSSVDLDEIRQTMIDYILQITEGTFEKLTVVDGQYTASTSGKILVLPTDNASLLPAYNETVSINRVSAIESPFGGMKNNANPDYCPGALYTPTTGVNLTDASGTNGASALPAGKLAELHLLSYNASTHALTQEFIIENTSTSNTEVQVDACTTGWDQVYSSGGTVSYNAGTITLTNSVADSSGRVGIAKNIGSAFCTGKTFIKFKIRSSQSGVLWFFAMKSDVSIYKLYGGDRFPIAANVWTEFVLPLNAPAYAGTNPCQNPYVTNGMWDITAVNQLWVAMKVGAGATATIDVKDVYTDVEKTAYVELTCPDNLADSSLQIYSHNGTAYQLCRTSRLNDTWSDVSATTTNCTFADGTTLDDVFGSAGAGRAVFPKGDSGQTVSGSTGSMTYAPNIAGAKKRIGLMVKLPTSDGGRTKFNKIRMKTVLYAGVGTDGKYSTTFDFADSTDASLGLQNMAHPWIALDDPTQEYTKFYFFTDSPQNLSYKVDETGEIYSMTLYSGDGAIYKGQYNYPKYSTNQTVYSFYPYDVDPTTYAFDWDSFTHICFIPYDMDATGNIAPHDLNSNTYFASLVSLAHAHGKKVLVGIDTARANIDNLILNYSTTIANNILAFLQSTGADGVCLDFERPTDPNNSVNNQNNAVIFKEFMKTVYQTLKNANSNYHISHAVAGYVPDYVKHPELCDYVDALYMMCYDYNCGPTTTGATSPYTTVTAQIKEYLKYIDREKLIVGFPLYGYRITIDPSETNPSAKGAVLVADSHHAMRMDESLAGATQYGRNWDSTDKAPWYAYQSNGTWYQVWYDDAESLEYKVDFAVTQRLGGYGFFALTYEQSQSQLWTNFVIRPLFTISLAEALEPYEPV